jgi:hypothetical protein
MLAVFHQQDLPLRLSRRAQPRFRGNKTCRGALMPSRRPALALAMLSLVTVPILSVRAHSEEFHCRRGDQVRRIEVRFADDADRLPCQVVYWRDAQSEEGPRVPWNADHERAFCINKAREMVDDLHSAGWTCDPDAQTAEDAAAWGAGKPFERFFHEPAAGAMAPSPDEDGANGSGEPDQATLQAALTRDIHRLEELGGAAPGRFRPEMATLGDLDGDGVADGAALLTHRDENGRTSHHLLAYLFDGRTFLPVARVNLEAYYQNFTNLVIEDIAEGGIELMLHTPRVGDPACCPTGRRRATFELQDGQLVLAAESESGA